MWNLIFLLGPTRLLGSLKHPTKTLTIWKQEGEFKRRNLVSYAIKAQIYHQMIWPSSLQLLPHCTLTLPRHVWVYEASDWRNDPILYPDTLKWTNNLRQLNSCSLHTILGVSHRQLRVSKVEAADHIPNEDLDVGGYQLTPPSTGPDKHK